MGIKKRKPTNPASRFQEYAGFEELTTAEPHKPLLTGMKRSGARNNRGHVTVRFRGGGHRQRYREIDFRRDKLEVKARVATIEYDPNRTARICLLHYEDGDKRYILWPLGLEVGTVVTSGETAEVNVGNAMPIRRIPLGTVIHNIELKKGRGGQLARSAGAGVQLMAREGSHAQIKMPSGEVRRVHVDCYATIGQVGNVEHSNISYGKAGRKRWLGKRPHNRGVSMNPVDHPMGGGEGKSSGGRHPTTPWGVPTKGYRTRNNKRTNRWIVKRRYQK
jgi:large subunit ribosomal protein L2